MKGSADIAKAISRMTIIQLKTGEAEFPET
jgi:hypothetical protein